MAKYRPTHRPPMAILQVFDDGRQSCELVRLRKDETSIGRAACDVSIPHDSWIAPHHLTIHRQLSKGKYRWSIKDVSGSGLFVRVRRAKLQNGSELLVGRQRLVFLSATSTGQYKATLNERLSRGSLPGESEVDGIQCASLTVARPDNCGPKLWLLGSDYWVGTSSECGLCLPEDPFMAAKHVLLTRTKDGQWQAETQKAPNGMWIRVEGIVVKQICNFQIGEQRFRLNV